MTEAAASATVKVLNAWLSRDRVATVDDYVRLLLAQDRFHTELDGLASAIYGDPLADSLLISKTDEMCQLLGQKVYPSYGYLRVYWPNARLPLHTDREGCDWTLSVTIARQPGTPIWPLELGDSATTTQEVRLQSGDALLFPGRQVRHGRSGTAPGWNMSLFLHWVTDPKRYLDGRSLVEQGAEKE